MSHGLSDTLKIQESPCLLAITVNMATKLVAQWGQRDSVK